MLLKTSGLYGLVRDNERQAKSDRQYFAKRLREINRKDRDLQEALVIASTDFADEHSACLAADYLIDRINRNRRLTDFWLIRLAAVLPIIALAVVSAFIIWRRYVNALPSDVSTTMLSAAFGLAVIATGLVCYFVDRHLSRWLQNREEAWLAAQIAALHFLYEDEKCRWRRHYPDDEEARYYNTAPLAAAYRSCPSLFAIRYEKETKTTNILVNLPRPMTAEQADNLGVAVGAGR